MFGSMWVGVGKTISPKWSSLLMHVAYHVIINIWVMQVMFLLMSVRLFVTAQSQILMDIYTPRFNRLAMQSSYYNSSNVCGCVCLCVPYLLWGPSANLRQTWWVYVGGPPICPWGLLFRKSQRVDGSTGHFCFQLYYIYGRLTPHHCKKHTAYDSRQHQTHATPLTKAHSIFCSLETGNFLVFINKCWLKLYQNVW